MARTLKVRKPTSAERSRLQAVLEETTDKHVRRRAEVILFYAAGLNGAEIAVALGVHPNTVYADFHIFDQQGLAGLRSFSHGGVPPRITTAQCTEIWRLAEREPIEFGLPFGRWSLTNFREFLIRRRHVLKQVSREHLRRILRKGGIRFRRVQRKLISHDPQRRAILARIRQVFKHLPPDGVLLFFDVKPIAVKAYGGRRFTSAKQLILERYQKTRGRFYLFAAYDVKCGRVRWRYYHRKASQQVCLFMQQVRRWYPTQKVWVVLDQDRAHPCKSRQTRHVMRSLKLHWISLPKGSPDDNPVETIFSDIQLMVLDNSNDPDEQTTQKRISQHLSRRNRRRGRFIRITYLPDSHKG
jgi:transposase